jgi:citrate lyase beta subunit
MQTRSFLFTPATRLERLEKARDSGADRVVIDLEDGVASEEKTKARQYVRSYLGAADVSHLSQTALRINCASTVAGIRDVAMLLDSDKWPGMLVLPKVESSKEIEQIVSISAESGKQPELLVTLETARGVEESDQIACACPQNAAIGFGSADYTAETGGLMSAAGLSWARGRIVNACALNGIAAIDGVCLDFKDNDALLREAQLVQEMGFSGKIAIHPAQISIINQVFTPTSAEADTARAMIAASNAAGGGAFSFNGKMVDGPVLARAHRILAAYTASEQ